MPAWDGGTKASGDEGDGVVGGVAVEVLASTGVEVGPWIGVAGGDLDLAKWDSGVDC